MDKFYESFTGKAYPDPGGIPKDCTHEVSFGYMDQYGRTERVDLHWHKGQSYVSVEAWNGWAVLAGEAELISALAEATKPNWAGKDKRGRDQYEAVKPEVICHLLEEHGFLLDND